MSSAAAYRANLTAFRPLTPGSFHGNRLALLSEHQAVVASGNQLLSVASNLPSRENESVSKFSYEGYQAPTPVDVQHEENLIFSTSPHSGEIQSVDYSSKTSTILSTDVYGNVNLHNTTTQDNTFIKSEGIVESGWAGVAIDNESDGLKYASAQFWAKRVCLYDGDKLTRKFNTIANPTQIVYLDAPGKSILAVADYNFLVLHDTRMGPRDGCIFRFSHTPDPIFTIASMATPSMFAYGGASRTVSIFELSKMAARAHWNSALKYDILYANFSSTSDSLMYLSGFDAEICCSDWSGEQDTDRFDGLRVESRWVGMKHHKESDTMVGLVENGSVYTVRNPAGLFSGNITPKRGADPFLQESKKKRRKSNSQDSSLPIQPAKN